MDYDKLDEAEVYRNACDNVKKIVKAIKAIRIKYYPNFSKISEKDKGVYDELNEKLEQISQQHGLDKLKTALMGEISAKYDNEKDNSENREQKSLDDILLQCYGAIDAEQQALATGKLGQAKKCQAILSEHQEEIAKMPESEQLLDRILEYKREKYGELSVEQDKRQEREEKWENSFKGLFEQTNAEKRKEATEVIQNQQQSKEEKQVEEMVVE